MNMLIGGGILIGTTLATVPIVHAISAEVLPLKYRSLASGAGFVSGAFAGLVGTLGSGAVTNVNAGGWRYIFWMQAAFHGVTFLGLALFYWPSSNIEYPKMTLNEYIWACDPIGSLLCVTSVTLMLLALDWLGGAYESSDPHVVVPLSIGLVCLVAFALYDIIMADNSNAEWKGRPDGLVAHVFFRQNANFALSVFAFAVEGWIFYSAVNSVVPQIVLNLGFADDAWWISVRQLSYQLVTLVVSIPIVWYTIRFKDMQTPLIVCFGVFLIVTICYATIRPSWSSAQLGINVLCGIGQAGPLSLLVACVQFSAPHAFLSTATGLAFSARAIGGAFGSAVLNAIINGRLSAYYALAVGAAATSAGLSADSVPRLLEYLEQGRLPDDAAATSGITPEIWTAALGASREEYAHAYRLAWSSVIPFVVLAIVAVACLKGVKELMTEKVEATVEHAERVEMGDDEL
ncbi:MFS general substrate transporter [Apiospora sp. TS-2023a]